MIIIFRVDASVHMGTGHLMRCLTVAEALRKRGAQIRFVCRDHTGNLITLLQQKAMPVTVLPAPMIKDTTLGEDYAAWLGVTQAGDAEQTIAALDGDTPDWLVVDHYGLDVEWEQRLRPYVSNLMVIDDLANRPHDCDVLLDQNYTTEGERRYVGLLPNACKLLAGPRYALLRPEYATYRKTMRTRDGQVKRVLVFLGGTDPQNLTRIALEALSHPELMHLEVDVVVGANNPHRKSIEQQVLHRPLTTLHEPRPHLADLMARADLAIGAGGATTWERMCLGLPTVVISFAENQRSASEMLAKEKLIHYAGYFPDIKMDHLTQLLKQLGHGSEKIIDLSIQNQLLVDGHGALRLVEVLCPSDINEIRLRPANEEDIIIYYNWANDPAVRQNAVSTSTISWTTHQKWFRNKIHDANSHLFVLEVACLPVGQIRFDRIEDEAHIDYSIDSIVRGRDWGPRLVALGTYLLQKFEPVQFRAEVKSGNEASSAVFLRNEFKESVSGGGYRSFYRNPVGLSELDE